jgi:hypothetical protein
MHQSKVFLVTALLALVGCGSDPGSGTQTLWVDADLTSDGSSAGTQAVIHVRQGGSSGAIMHNATVELIDDRGVKTVVPFEGVVSGDFVVGQFHAREFNWTPGFRLRITNDNSNSPDDYLEALIAGPGLTTITAPAANSTFNRSTAQNLTVRWRDESGRVVTSAEVEVDRIDYRRATEDKGLYDIDYAVFQPRDDERIIVRRWTEIPLRGGTTGSTFRSTTTARVPLIVQ